LIRKNLFRDLATKMHMIAERIAWIWQQWSLAETSCRDLETMTLKRNSSWGPSNRHPLLKKTFVGIWQPWCI
jgi:hypothetical protein